MIILCGGIKGGIGKTTVATNLAAIRAKRLGAGKVALVDSDPQESAYKFTQLRNDVLGDAGFHCFKLTGKPVRQGVLGLAGLTDPALLPKAPLHAMPPRSGSLLPKAGAPCNGSPEAPCNGKYEDVIIDAGVGDSTGQRAAMTIASVLVLPFRPSSYDVWTIGNLTQLIGEMLEVNPTLRVIAFLNQADHVGHDNSEAAEMLREAEHVTLIGAQLGYRKAFRNTAAGKSVVELMPQDPKATAEMLDLYHAVFDCKKIHFDGKVMQNESRRAV